MASIPFTGRAERSRDSWHWALPLLPIAISVFLLSALTWHRTQGELGEGLLPSMVVGLSGFLGFQPAFMLCLLIMAWSSIWFFTARVEKPGTRIMKILALTLCLSILVSLKAEGVSPDQGSILGRALASRLMYVFGYAFSSLLVAGVAFVFFLLSTDFFFYSYFEGIGRDTGSRKTSLDDEGVEAATVQAFESLAAEPRIPGYYRRERAALRRRSPSGRATLVIEEDSLDRVFPGPLESTVAEDAAAEQEAAAELEAESAEAVADPIEVTADFELAVAEISAGSDFQEEPVLEESSPEVAEAEPELAEAEEEEEEEEEEEYEEEEEEEEEDDLELSAEEEEEEEYEEEEEEEEEDDLELSAEEEEEEEYEEEEEEEDDPELSAEEEEEYEEEDEEFGEEVDLETTVPEAEIEAEPAVLLPRPRHHPKRQGSLFPSAEGDGDLVDEAARLVIANDRASASFLRRRLRISRQEALGVIQSLCEHGVVECEEGAAQGRVVMDLATWESR